MVKISYGVEPSKPLQPNLMFMGGAKSETPERCFARVASGLPQFIRLGLKGVSGTNAQTIVKNTFGCTILLFPVPMLMTRHKVKY
jgi:hypothetical protein